MSEGIHGYIEFLQKIYEGKKSWKREELRQWAESLSWTDLEIKLRKAAIKQDAEPGKSWNSCLTQKFPLKRQLFYDSFLKT